MKLLHFTLAASLGIEASALARPPVPTCNQNKCLDRVKQGAAPSGFGACKAFFRTTIIPPTVSKTTTIVERYSTPTTILETFITSITSTKLTSDTSTSVTTTTTTTTLEPVPPGRNKRAEQPNTTRTVSQTTLPTYVSGFCRNTAQYSSACSCIRAPRGTTTKTAPTRLIRKTKTTTVPNPVSTTTLSKTEIISTTTKTSFLSTITSVSTDIKTATTCNTAATTPTVVLTSPTPILLANDSNHDDVLLTLSDLPFAVSFYGQSAKSINVDTNGFISIPSQPDPGSDATGAYCFFDNVALPAWQREVGQCYTNRMPDTSVVAFWDDLYIFKDTAQGIYYEIKGSPGNRSLLIEWYMSHYQDPSQYYHFIMTLPESSSQNVKFTYYDVSDAGVSATVGAQSYPAQLYTQYSYNNQVITPGLELEYNPETNEFESKNPGCIPSGGGDEGDEGDGGADGSHTDE